jgi:glycosyltransferase involved in cell wall biosynthesis
VSLVLHILPADARRGAQRHARALCDELHRPEEPHRILTIFRPRLGDEQATLRAEVELGVPDSLLRRGGFEPRAAARLHRALKEAQPQLVIAHGGESLKYAALVCARGTPLIYHKIGTLPPAVRRRSLRRLVQRVITRRASFVVCVSADVMREAHAVLSVPAERSAVIPNGRDPRVFFPPTRRTCETQPCVVFVGQLVYTKRPGLFVEVVERLREEGHSFRAVIAGEGPLRRLLERTVRHADVELLGARDDVAAILRRSDIFVFTSEATGEGMPGVLIEAGLTGLPTVATDVPGARSVIEHGVTGFVVADTAGLLGSVRALLLSGELRRRMGDAAREKCRAEFTIDVGVSRWRDLVRGFVQ